MPRQPTYVVNAQYTDAMYCDTNVRASGHKSEPGWPSQYAATHVPSPPPSVMPNHRQPLMWAMKSMTTVSFAMRTSEGWTCHASRRERSRAAEHA